MAAIERSSLKRDYGLGAWTGVGLVALDNKTPAGCASGVRSKSVADTPLWRVGDEAYSDLYAYETKKEYRNND
jgi:hypothetical protein